MADSYVCSGATMKCTMGTSTARLTVLPIRTVFLAGQPMANISDHLTMVNLAPFGRCRSLGFPATAAATAAHHGHLTPMPCMHNTPFPWMNGKNDYIVKGDPALLKSSTCQCMWGGTISLVTDGQVGEGTQWVQKKKPTNYDEPELCLKHYQVTTSQSETHHPAQESKLPTGSSIDILLKANRINAVKQSLKGKKNDEIKSNGSTSNLSLHNSKSKNRSKFQNNCGTTSNTFLLRMLGYQITARGVSDTLSNDLLNENAFRLWTNDTSRIKAFNNWATKTAWKQKKTDKATFYKNLLTEACKEEGYYLLTLSWDDRVVNEKGKVLKPNTRHATIIKSVKDDKGNIILKHIEPQNPLDKEHDIDKLLNRMAPLDQMPEKNVTITGSGRPGIGDGVMRVLDKNGQLAEGLKIDENLFDAFAVIHQ